MNFAEALFALSEARWGGRIRRECWEAEIYVEMRNDTDYGPMLIIVVPAGLDEMPVIMSPWSPRQYDIFGLDWAFIPEQNDAEIPVP